MNSTCLGGPTTMGLPNRGATPLQVHVSKTGVDSLGASNKNMPIEQHPNAQQPPPKYVKIWEGTLSGVRRGQPLFICKLEGYMSGTTAETLAAEWPEILEIGHLIDQEHMKYCTKDEVEFLVFRTLNQHGFLEQLKERKLCVAIQLPSQTLLLSVSERADRLIGMLLPGDMVVLKPRVSFHQPTMQQQQQPPPRQQQLRNHQQQPRQQQLQEQQQQLQVEQQLLQQLQQQLQRQQQQQQHMHRQPQGLLLQQPKMEHQQQPEEEPQQMMQGKISSPGPRPRLGPGPGGGFHFLP